MVTSGFYDSRYYNAGQFGDMFDGLITQGVYSEVGKRFEVTPGTGMKIVVDTGRAWVGEKWVYNDSTIILDLTSAPYTGSRIDTVAIETDDSLDPVTGKAGRIIVLTGVVAASKPQKRELINDDATGVHQIPIAYITVAEGTTQIASANIEYPASDMPYVTGILEHVTITDLLASWRLQFPEAVAEFQRTSRAEFEEWFSELEDELDENQAAHLQAEINQLKRDIVAVGRAEDMEF